MMNLTFDNIYSGRMSVFSYVKNSNSNASFLEKILVLDNVPCLLTSMASRQTTLRDSSKSQNVNYSSSVKKLFLSNEFDIVAGSYVEVLQHGKLYTFDYCSDPFVYQSHQELILENSKII